MLKSRKIRDDIILIISIIFKISIVGSIENWDICLHPDCMCQIWFIKFVQPCELCKCIHLIFSGKGGRSLELTFVPNNSIVINCGSKHRPSCIVKSLLLSYVSLLSFWISIYTLSIFLYPWSLRSLTLHQKSLCRFSHIKVIEVSKIWNFSME